MVKEHPLSTRHRAVGMVSGGMIQSAVAKELGASVRSIQIWMVRNRRNESLENRIGLGREAIAHPSVQHRFGQICPEKIPIYEEIGKKITSKGYPVSKTTVHNYLTKCLHLKPLKPRCLTKLTEAQIRRLAFVQEPQKKTGPSLAGSTYRSAMSLPSRYSTGQTARTNASVRTRALMSPQRDGETPAENYGTGHDY